MCSVAFLPCPRSCRLKACFAQCLPTAVRSLDVPCLHWGGSLLLLQQVLTWLWLVWLVVAVVELATVQGGGHNLNGTILMPTFGRGNESAAPFVTMAVR